MNLLLSEEKKGIVGVGLRPTHYPYLESNSEHCVDWFEVISENYMDTQGRPLEILQKIRRDHPIATHGVSMNLANPNGLDMGYLKQLKKLVERVEPFVVSDHLCWTGTHAHGNLHDLLPVPYTQEAVEMVTQNIHKIQEILKRKFTIENVSTYLRFKHSEMTEWEFISEIQKVTGCGILLDINNVFVNSQNHHFAPRDFVDGLPLQAVEQIHLAGHTDMGDHLFDTHTGEVAQTVWDLYRYTLEKIKPETPFLLEWDDDIPEFPILEEEALKAKKIWEELYG